MEIFQLMDNQGSHKNYRGFNVKPSSNCLIRVIEIDPATVVKYGQNVYNDLSFNKVYKVYRIVHVNQLLIHDDANELVQLYPKQYQVVEEVTDNEIRLLKQNKEIVETLNKVIISKGK